MYHIYMPYTCITCHMHVPYHVYDIDIHIYVIYMYSIYICVSYIYHAFNIYTTHALKHRPCMYDTYITYIYVACTRYI